MTEERFYTEGKYVMQDGEVYVICSGEHNADVVATALNELLKENEQLKQTLQEVYDDDYYLKQFITAIINIYNKNNGVSPIRLEMVWDSLDMDKTSLKHLKSSFYE